MKSVNNNILNIGATVAHDNSIIKKDFYAYTPYTNSFGESEEVRIAIQNQGTHLLPCECFLYLELTVTTEKNNETATDKVKFVRNFPSFLFSEARYELNGVEIDRIRNVGMTSTMKLGAASCQSNTSGYYQFNKLFTNKIAQSANAIVYDVAIPLSIWFGFCDDYRKIILNSRHELILKRERDSVNCVRGGGKEDPSTNVKIAISKLEWTMPHITLANPIKLAMNQLN